MDSVFTLLLELGLNKYESRIYLTLVEEGISTAKTISDITGIPYGKIYEIINSLSNKGFVITLPTKPLKCQAVSPQEVINNVKNHTDKKLKKIEKSVKDTLEPIFAKNKKAFEPNDSFLIIKGRTSINKKLEELVSNARQRINIITTENGLKKLVFQKELLKRAKENGKGINIACNITKNNAEDATSLSEICDIKHCDKKISNHFFSNGSHSIIIEPSPDDEDFVHGRDFGIWIVSRSFTKFLDSLFHPTFRDSLVAAKRIKDLR